MDVVVLLLEEEARDAAALRKGLLAADFCC